MKLKTNKMFKNIIIIFTLLTFIEILFRAVSNIAIIDTSILRVILSNLIISIFISFLISWFNNKINRVIISILSFLFCLYAFLQLGFNNFLGVYISINTKSQLGAVIDYIKEFFASFLPKYYLLFLPFVLLLAYYIFIDKYFSKPTSDKKFILKKRTKYEYQIRSLGTTISIIILGFLYIQSLTVGFMQNELQTVATKDLFNNPSVPSIVVNEFGVLGFGILDLKAAYIVPENEVVYAATETEIQDTERKIDDTYWKQVIEEEKNKTMLSISNYLINNKITDLNDYTGMFSGKNLIVIMLESVNEIIINEEYYPNFYKMYTEGWAFKNNYSPRNSCSTGNNEFSGMTGLYTIYNNCTANVYKNNTYNTAIFNLFKEADYNTASMHNYTEAYYYRNKIHTNLGSDKYYGVQDLGIAYKNEYRNWSSDEDFMEVAMDIALEEYTDKPFMLWLTTVSSHQPYVVSSIEGDKYLDLFKDTDYPMDLKRYMSKLKTLDNSLGILMNKLEDAGILEDTVIVMYGDHYPYGLSNKTINKVLDYDLSDYEVERTPFVIYNSVSTSKSFEQYTSFINITPTVANLFGLDYDPRLYMGSDILSDEYQSIVVYSDGSWKNEKAYYNASNGTIKYYSEEEYTVEEIKEINNSITLKMQMSSSIIKNNFFKYLDEKIEKLERESSTMANLGEDE